MGIIWRRKNLMICLRNHSQQFLGVLRGAFKGFGCPKRHPDALLAKTMVQGVGNQVSHYSNQIEPLNQLYSKLCVGSITCQ